MIKAYKLIESISHFINIYERNVVNISEIDGWISDFSRVVKNREIQEWLQKFVRKYLIEKYPEVREVNPHELSKLHAPAWVDQAIERGDVLYTVDISLEFEEDVEKIVDAMELLYPGREFDKMVKTPMSKDLVVQAERTLKSDQKRSGVEETGLHYPDGSRWVKLKQWETIKWEGDEMANCLKRFTQSYYDAIKNGKEEVYSLRDSHNKPRLTVLTDKSGAIKQAKGYKNEDVPVEYADHVYDLITKNNFEVDLVSGSEHDLDAVGVFWKGAFYKSYTDIPVEERWFDLLKRWKNLSRVSEKVKQCLEEGVNPDLRESPDDKTALGLAVEYNYPACVEVLCHYGADPMLRPQGNPQSPLDVILLYTIRFEKQRALEYIDMMLPNTKPERLVDEDGQSLLFKLIKRSAAFSEQEALKKFLDFGASQDVLSPAGLTILQVAVINSNYPIIDMLLEYDQDINYNKKVHVLDLAVGDPYLPRELLDHGASPKYATTSVLVEYALKNTEDTKLLLRLIEEGADVNAVSNPDKYTPLMVACAFSKDALELAKAMVRAGARLDIQDKWGRTVFDLINYTKKLSDEEAEELRAYLE